MIIEDLDVLYCNLGLQIIMIYQDKGNNLIIYFGICLEKIKEEKNPGLYIDS